ncbi:MAG TPA: hypothetical protein VNN21_00405 [Dehalococcoidia bacterium]|nr:hypothetical protein [Dehalococcoidia bacterium]
MAGNAYSRRKSRPQNAVWELVLDALVLLLALAAAAVAVAS